MRTLVLIVFLLAGSASSLAAQPSRHTRAQEIAASFNKYKNVVKEKRGSRKHVYKDVRSEPDLKANLRDYSGTYEVPDLGLGIVIRVDRDGGTQGEGYETGQPSPTFTLENATVRDGVLSATRRLRDGTAEKLEGVFMTRTERKSPTDGGITTSGLGVVLGSPVERDGITYERLFYQSKR
ncbi:MAG TPA: hypothetical protein VI504_11245 [Candidatus Eisenbacteria bacterium]|jgi:hypothetical protein